MFCVGYMLTRSRMMKHTRLWQDNLYEDGFQSVKWGYLELMKQPCMHMWCVCAHVLREIKLYPTLAIVTSLNLDLFIFHSKWRKRILGPICTAQGSQVQKPLCWEPESSESKLALWRGDSALGKPLGLSIAKLGCLAEQSSRVTHTPVLPLSSAIIPSSFCHQWSTLSTPPPVFFLLLLCFKYSLQMLISYFLFFDCWNPPLLTHQCSEPDLAV